MGRVLVFEEEKVGRRRYCCKQMKYAVEHVCRIHTSLFECPDNIVYYSPRFREYGIILHNSLSFFSTTQAAQQFAVEPVPARVRRFGLVLEPARLRSGGRLADCAGLGSVYNNILGRL